MTGEVQMSRRFGVMALLVAVVVIVLAGREFREAARPEIILSGEARRTALSAYVPGLKGTPGDTPTSLPGPSRPCC
jgi:hypothetical protein